MIFSFKKTVQYSKQFFQKYFFSSHSSRSRGFSLFEMLVAIAIFTILASILLVKNTQFQGNILVTNFAYQLALDIRQAQVFGIDVKSAPVYQTNNSLGYNNGYGIHFDSSNSIGPSTTASSKNFVLFNDNQSDSQGKPTGVYYPNNASLSLVSLYTIPIGGTNEIVNFCISTVRSGINAYCTSQGRVGTISNLNIVFRRPDPSAIITVDSSVMSSLLDASDGITSTTVYVSSVRGDGQTKGVEVDANGQIFVQ
jgi:prepilin-type N-terminal cleavage/methylation domain-containing protein